MVARVKIAVFLKTVVLEVESPLYNELLDQFRYHVPRRFGTVASNRATRSLREFDIEVYEPVWVNQRFARIRNLHPVVEYLHYWACTSDLEILVNQGIGN